MFETIGLNTQELATSGTLLRLVISTALLVTVVLVARWLSARYIRRNVASMELRRRWLVYSRNGLILIMLLGLVIIWAAELRTFALSVVAIAVAFVVATKELILCVTGSIVKTGAGSFNIGDRIQVKDFRGDVIDQNLLATTILEVGPGKLTHQRTGRMTVIPNALFVSEPVVNESYTHDYVLHVFTVPFKRNADWRGAQKALLEAANQACEPFVVEAKRYLKKLNEYRGLDAPSVDPRVTLQVPSAEEIHLIVRIPALTDRRSAIEQSILTEVFSRNDFLPLKIEEKASDREELSQEAPSTVS
ncbi:mechanosensitive ion channel domain-containing protein [Marinimicrobium agarilyticum]|uniref:mechanosensitive ion channel domain-containing protein n=1 Tax=Marinimicrobium agarilyticum TaxID=306546 RepID=UPI000413D995|nr:mechanosensitive ion channel domain-containing protein [Marinimicrobium agarilyticum]